MIKAMSLVEIIQEMQIKEVKKTESWGTLHFRHPLPWSCYGHWKLHCLLINILCKPHIIRLAYLFYSKYHYGAILETFPLQLTMREGCWKYQFYYSTFTQGPDQYNKARKRKKKYKDLKVGKQTVILLIPKTNKLERISRPGLHV